MTEQEAIQLHISENIHRIEVIEDFLSTNSDSNDKECRKNIDILTKTNKALEEVQQYREIGTLEECRAAVEKQTAKKPKEYEDKFYGCPTCGNVILHKWEKYPTKLMDKKNGLPYCLGCGQRILWEV